MKKLLIAIGAAAMVSLGAQAYGTLNTGTDFEGLAAGALDTTKNDSGLAEAPYYWADRGDVTGDSVIVAVESPANKYLKVDETEELTRLIHASGQDFAPETVGDTQDVYFSSKVQFTAADDEPAVSNGVDKIIVWAKAPAEDAEPGTTTNLMVTALNASYDAEAFDTGVAIDCEQWYELKIIATAQPAGSTSPIAFKVYLNDTLVGTYNSMVRSGENRLKISSVSFKGTGAVDDLDWGTEEPVAPTTVDVSATCTIDGVAVAAADLSLYVDIAKADPTIVGSEVTVTVYSPNFDDDTVSADGLTFSYDGTSFAWVATYTLTAADAPAKVFAISITTSGSGGDDWPDDPSTDAGKTAAQAYGISGVLADAPADKLAAWAKANNIAYADRNTLDSDLYLEAFLLNCAPEAEAVAAAKANFKFTAITPGTVPTITGNYNGEVEVYGGTSLDDIATWDEAVTTDNFYKAKLVMPAVTAAPEP